MQHADMKPSSHKPNRAKSAAKKLTKKLPNGQETHRIHAETNMILPHGNISTVKHICYFHTKNNSHVKWAQSQSLQITK